MQKYFFSKEDLEDLYINQKKSLRDIAKFFNTNKTTIKRHLVKFDIKVRNHSDFFREVGFSEQHRSNISKSRKGILVGEKAGHYKGGVTKIYQLIRGMPEYKDWRKKCFIKNDYTCQICSKRGGRLNADHIKPLCIIIREFKISGTVDARLCDFLWSLDNARTLCEKCHRKTDTFAGAAFKKIREWEQSSC